MEPLDLLRPCREAGLSGTVPELLRTDSSDPDSFEDRPQLYQQLLQLRKARHHREKAILKSVKNKASAAQRSPSKQDTGSKGSKQPTVTLHDIVHANVGYCEGQNVVWVRPAGEPARCIGHVLETGQILPNQGKYEGVAQSRPTAVGQEFGTSRNGWMDLWYGKEISKLQKLDSYRQLYLSKLLQDQGNAVSIDSTRKAGQANILPLSAGPRIAAKSNPAAGLSQSGASHHRATSPTKLLIDVKSPQSPASPTGLRKRCTQRSDALAARASPPTTPLANTTSQPPPTGTHQPQPHAQQATEPSCRDGDSPIAKRRRVEAGPSRQRAPADPAPAPATAPAAPGPDLPQVTRLHEQQAHVGMHGVAGSRQLASRPPSKSASPEQASSPQGTADGMSRQTWDDLSGRAPEPSRSLQAANEQLRGRVQQLEAERRELIATRARLEAERVPHNQQLEAAKQQRVDEHNAAAHAQQLLARDLQHRLGLAEQQQQQLQQQVLDLQQQLQQHLSGEQQQHRAQSPAALAAAVCSAIQPLLLEQVGGLKAYVLAANAALLQQGQQRGAGGIALGFALGAHSTAQGVAALGPAPGNAA